MQTRTQIRQTSDGATVRETSTRRREVLKSDPQGRLDVTEYNAWESSR